MGCAFRRMWAVGHAAGIPAGALVSANQRWRTVMCPREIAYAPTIRQRNANASGLKPTVRAAKRTASQSRRTCTSLSVASIAVKPSEYA